MSMEVAETGGIHQNTSDSNFYKVSGETRAYIGICPSAVVIETKMGKNDVRPLNV